VHWSSCIADRVCWQVSYFCSVPPAIFG
jgi:hypothetical protein